MNVATKIEPGTDIALAVSSDPGIVLLDTEKFDAWYEKLKAGAPTNVDISTSKGRDKLRSYAADVRKEKAAIDKARLRLTKEWRDMTAQANEAGKVIEQRLEGLAVEVRKPLTDWEDAEKARVESCRADIEAFKRAGIVTLDDTAATVRERGIDLWKQAIDPERFGDLAAEALAAKEASVGLLKTALARLTQEEADRAELERLRAENEAREAKEREEQEARERAEAAAEEARQAEERRIAAERADAERIERAKEEAAQAERDRLQREHDEALAAERRRAEEAEAAAQAERDKAAAAAREAEQAEAARIAEERRVAAETAKREANKAHQKRVMGAAKVAIMGLGVSETDAIAVVKAIVAGDVPAVKMEF